MGKGEVNYSFKKNIPMVYIMVFSSIPIKYYGII